MIRHLLLDFDRTLNDSDAVYEKRLDGFLGMAGREVLNVWEVVHREILSKEPRQQHEDLDLHFQRLIDRLRAADPGATRADLKRRIRSAQQECWDATALFEDAIPFLHGAKDAGFALYIATGDFGQQKADAIEHQAGRRFFDGAFDESVLGLGKGKRDYFDRLLLRLGASPDAAMVIGDSLANDIAPAKQAGIAAIWLRRKNEELRPGVDPDFTLATLAECSAHLRSLPPRPA